MAFSFSAFRSLLTHNLHHSPLYTMRAMFSFLPNCHSVTYMTQYGRIPVEKLEVLYSKSSGPGGQNVNKLKTRVQIRFDIHSADWLPEEVKQAILAKYKNKFTKEGILMLDSQSTRSRISNERDVLNKLQTIIEKSFTKPGVTSDAKIMKIKDLQAKAKERRKLFKLSRKLRKSDPIGFI